MKTNGPHPNRKGHGWWEPWKNSLRLINTFSAHGIATLTVIGIAKVLEYVIENVEKGKKISHPNALDFVHYGDLSVVLGIIVILGYKLLKGLSKDEN